jgi:pimeloyl-ACP methyl ester carboxylesterase
VPVLLVEAGADQIVPAASQELLRQALPQAVVWSLEGIGHSLLGTPLIDPVLDWLAQALADPSQNHGRAPSPPSPPSPPSHG